MSFSCFLQQKQLSSLVEDLMRARFKDNATHQFSLSQILPVHDWRLQTQQTLVAIEMQSDTVSVYRSCAHMIHERIDQRARALDETLADLADSASVNATVRPFVLNLVGALVDSRVYHGLREHFGGVYVYADDCDIKNVLALRNVRERRDKPVLLLYFHAAQNNTESTNDNESQAAHEPQDIRLLNSALNRRRFSVAQTSRQSLNWIRHTWQRTKNTILRRNV